MDLKIEKITKIEGHGQLDLKIRQGKVEELHFKIVENKRFYTKAIEGKPFIAAPSLMSRICGTCSVSHLLCCIQAVENALEFKASPQLEILRKLTTYGLMIRDHALHLYFFSMPDVFGKDSILEFDQNDPKQADRVHEAFAIKTVGNNLAKLVAGRSVHAPYPMVGGFTKIPEEDGVKKIIGELKDIRPKIFNLMKVFQEWPAELKRKTTFVCQKSKDFSFMDGPICTSANDCIEKGHYMEHLERVVIPYSTATGYNFREGNYFVGSLARLNINKDALHLNTKKDAAEFLKWFPSENVFDNNLAQAIEILHAIDHSIDILENTKFQPERLQIIPPKNCSGVGVVEAPRGTLYYKLDIDEKGMITHADVITPTQQNQINIEHDLRHFVEQNITLSKEKMALEMEKIVRAYDPCMSCATHFLRINWM